MDVSGIVPPRPGARGGSSAVDLVAEHICWFEHHGSPPLAFELRA